VRGQAFNFGVDQPITVIEMINTVIRLSDHPGLEPIILNEARNEIQAQYLSSQKAGRVLGWKPRFSLEKSLKETMDWYREFLDESEE
jgi:CDP-glucose 4,6-dehydratase